MNNNRHPGKKKKLPMADRRRIVADLYLKGWTQYAIGQEIGVSHPTVGRDLEYIRQEWVNQAVQDFDQLKAKELGKVDKLERTYWDQYDLSKKSNEHGLGYEKYLAGIHKCIDQRCKILGLNAPTKTQSQVEIRDYTKLSDDELQAILES